MYFQKDFEKQVKTAQGQQSEWNVVTIFNQYKETRQFTEPKNSKERYAVRISDKHFKNGKFELNKDGTITVLGQGTSFTKTEEGEKEVKRTIEQRLLLNYDVDFDDVALEFASFPKNTMKRDVANTWKTLGLNVGKNTVDVSLLKAYGPDDKFYPVPNDAALELGVLDSLLGFSIGDGDRFEYLRANPIIAVRQGHFLSLGLGSNIGNTQIQPTPSEIKEENLNDKEKEKLQQDLQEIEKEKEEKNVEDNVVVDDNGGEAPKDQDIKNIDPLATSKDLETSKIGFNLLQWEPTYKDKKNKEVKGLKPTNVVIDGSVNVFNLLFLRFNTFRDIEFTQFAVTGDAQITQKKKVDWETGLINDRADRRNFTFNRKDFYQYDPDTKEPLTKEPLKKDAGGLFVYQKLQIGNGDSVTKAYDKKMAKLGLGGDMYVYDAINQYADKEVIKEREKTPALLISGAQMTAIDSYKFQDHFEKKGLLIKRWSHEDKKIETYPVSKYYVNGDVEVKNSCFFANGNNNIIQIYAKGKIDFHHLTQQCPQQKVFLYAEKGVYAHVPKGEQLTINGGIIGKRQVVGEGKLVVNGVDLEKLQTPKHTDILLKPVGKKIVANP
ncbi:hypothetical protein [Massilibacterium senegalense]|uniref:hypothetical protein n=1 Tax=Massilibacterium senegalense TaxID=1632858 RepID=UPI0011CA8ECB|nr:hypothetical protein [Massilibacterium senegalense]